MGSFTTTLAVTRHVLAFNNGDVDLLLEGFTDTAVWATGTSTATTTAELRALFGWSMANLAPRLEVLDRLVDGDRAACQLTEELPVDGRRRVDAIAVFFQVEGEKIASGKVYRLGTAVT